MTNEQKLAALESATQHINDCEYDWIMDGERAYEPFSFFPWNQIDGTTIANYDRHGNLTSVERLGEFQNRDMYSINLLLKD